MKRNSKKRDAILSCLRQTDTHPTAEWVYQSLKPEYPNLSLGTIYRNLSEFKREGVIASVGVVDGLERFDGCVEPHSHLICRCCGAVIDAGIAACVDTLAKEAERETGGTVEKIAITFTGICRRCQDHHVSNS